MSSKTPAPLAGTEPLPEAAFVPDRVTREAVRPAYYQSSSQSWLLATGCAFGGLCLFLSPAIIQLGPLAVLACLGALPLLLVGLRWKHAIFIYLRKHRLRGLLGPAGTDDRYPLVVGPHFSIDLVIAKSRILRWPKVLFHCHFHGEQALPFQLQSGKKPKLWSYHAPLTARVGYANEPALRYYYQGHRRRLDAAITAFASELGTVRPLSLVDRDFVCQWLWAEKTLSQPDALLAGELGHAVQKVAMMATRIAGGGLPLADLAAMFAPRHHVDYRRRALIMLLDGYTSSAEGRARLARQPLSHWYEFGVPVAAALGLSWQEATLEAECRALSPDRFGLLFFALGRVGVYPGAGSAVPSTLPRVFLNAWFTDPRFVADPVAVPHLIACYFEGMLPPDLILKHIVRDQDPRTTGFLAEIVLHGPAAHAVIAKSVLARRVLKTPQEQGDNPFPQLAKAEYDKLQERLQGADFSMIGGAGNQPLHLELAEALGNAHRFKMLLRRLQDEDDRAGIPHLIACYHLPYMRTEILTFIGRAHDERVLLFLHQVLSAGSTKEVRLALEVLRHHGTRLCLAPLQESRRRLGRNHRELFDDVIAAINQRFPAFAEAGALSPVALHGDGALSLADDASLQGAVSRIDTPAADAQISPTASPSSAARDAR